MKAIYKSGQGPYSVYFETGEETFIIRRVNLKFAKIEALKQAQGRNLAHVTVSLKGVEVWCACVFNKDVTPKCGRVRPKKASAS